MDFYYEVTDMIKKTESLGQDLMIDSFIIGCMVGRGMVKDIADIQKVVNHLSDLKQHIENNQISPFARDEFFIQQLSPLTQSILTLNNNDDEKAKKKAAKKTKTIKGSTKTNQPLIDDQSQFEQKQIVQESQMQEKETKTELPKQEQQSQYEQKPEVDQSVQTRAKKQNNNTKKSENKKQ